MGTMVFISGKHDWGKSTLIKALVKKIPMTKITYIDFNGEECPEPNGSGDILCRGVVKSFDGSEKNIGFSSGGDTAKHIENAFKALTVNKENWIYLSPPVASEAVRFLKLRSWQKNTVLN